MGTSTAGDQFRQTELSENVSQLIRSNMPHYWGLHETSGGSRSPEALPFIQGDDSWRPAYGGQFRGPHGRQAQAGPYYPLVKSDTEAFHDVGKLPPRRILSLPAKVSLISNRLAA